MATMVREIVREEVAKMACSGPKQLKKNSVTTAKLKKEAVTAAKVKKGTLTGDQINASSLGIVPSAVHATSAYQAASADQATKAANGAVQIDFVSLASDPPPPSVNAPAVHEIFNRDGTTIRASCIDAGPEKGVRTYATVGSSVDATLKTAYTRFNNPGLETAILG